MHSFIFLSPLPTFPDLFLPSFDFLLFPLLSSLLSFLFLSSYFFYFRVLSLYFPFLLCYLFLLFLTFLIRFSLASHLLPSPLISFIYYSFFIFSVSFILSVPSSLDFLFLSSLADYVFFRLIFSPLLSSLSFLIPDFFLYIILSYYLICSFFSGPPLSSPP